MRRSSTGIAIAALLGLPAAAAAVPFDPASPTTLWTPIDYPTTAPDWADDQRTGIPEADVVGDLVHPAFYTIFDDAGTPSTTDGTLGFRIRLGAEKSPAGFSQVAAVGIDGDLDGALDLFVLVDNGGSSDRIAIHEAGSGANTSPATTTISATGVSYAETALDYDWRPVTIAIDPSATIFDVDADGDVDHFLSFAVPFQDLVDRFALLGISNVEETTAFRYVMGTSSQASSLSQDLGGPNGQTASALSFADLGAFSIAYSASVTPIPEPGTGLLLGAGLLGLAAARSRLRPGPAARR